MEQPSLPQKQLKQASKAAAHYAARSPSAAPAASAASPATKAAAPTVASRPSSEIIPGSYKSPEAEAIDRWFEDLSYYERTFEHMAKARLDDRFCVELAAVENWFKFLSDPERTTALYTLFQNANQLQVRFFIAELQKMAQRDLLAGPISQAPAISTTPPTATASSSVSTSASTSVSAAVSPAAVPAASVKSNAFKTAKGMIASGTSSHEGEPLADDDIFGARSMGTVRNTRRLYDRHSAPVVDNSYSQHLFAVIASSDTGSATGHAPDTVNGVSSSNAVSSRPPARPPPPPTAATAAESTAITPTTAVLPLSQKQPRDELGYIDSIAAQVAAPSSSVHPKHSSTSSNGSTGLGTLAIPSMMRPSTPVNDTIGSADWSRMPTLHPAPSQRTTSLGATGIHAPSPVEMPRMPVRQTSNQGSTMHNAIPSDHPAVPPVLNINISPTRSVSPVPGIFQPMAPASPGVNLTVGASGPLRATSASTSALMAANGLGINARVATPIAKHHAGPTTNAAGSSISHPSVYSSISAADAANSSAVSIAYMSSALGAMTISSQDINTIGHPSPGWSHIAAMPPSTTTALYASSDLSDDTGEYESGDTRIRTATGIGPHGKDKGKIPESVDLDAIRDVPGWLRSLRLHKYTPVFEHEDWRAMIKMNEKMLIQRGVAALGARRKMLKVFELVRKDLDAKGVDY